MPGCQPGCKTEGLGKLLDHHLFEVGNVDRRTQFGREREDDRVAAYSGIIRKFLPRKDG